MARYCFARKIQMPHQNLKKFTYSILWVMDLIKSIKNSAGEKIMKLKQILCLLFIATALFTTCSNSSSSSSSDDPVSQEQTQQTGCASNSDCPEGYLCNSYGECVPIRKANGEACTSNSECLSGTCANGRCVELPHGCIAIDENENCLRCTDGYYMDSSRRCVALPNHCMSGDADGNCLACAEGYTLIDGRCEASF